MTALSQDFRFALRRLRQAPLFTLFAVVTLALAIGIVTAVYTLIRAGFRPELGLDDADRLVVVAGHRAVSSPDFEDMGSQSRTLETVGAWTTFTTALVARGVSEFASGELVSGDYFRTVGLRPVRGRLLDKTDDHPGAPSVVVLSVSAWRSRFGRDPSAIGSSVKIGGRPFEVVGIVPESFRGVRPRGGFSQPDAWLPLSAAPLLASRFSRQDPNRRDHQWLSVVGRLAASRTLVDATAELRMIADRIDAVAPLPDERLFAGGSVPRKRDWTAKNAEESLGLGEVRDVRRAVLMLPTLVLIVACTNLANFALSRGVARQTEFGVRLAIGASRWQLVRSQLVEHAMVAGLGGVCAIVVANRLLALVASTARQIGGDMPQFRVEARIDGAVLLAVGGAALLSVIVAGLVPALQLTRRNLSEAMGGQAATALPRWRGRSNLIALQVGLSVALLLVAALCVRQLPKLHERVQSGMSLERVALVSVPFTQQSIDETATRRTVEAFLGAVRELPGVTSASASSARRYSDLVGVAPEGQPIAKGNRGPTTRRLSISPTYFQTVGLSVRSGRSFDDRDTAGGERVVILNETQARSLFGTVSVVGRRLSIDADLGSPVTTVTIVGVAADTRVTSTTRENVETMLYVPWAQRFEDLVPIELQARAADGVDPAALARIMRDSLRRLDPDVAVGFVGLADVVDVGPRVVMRYFVLAFGTLAFLALGFAMSGLYGVLTHVVSRRTRELGVRAALGADSARIVRLVLKDGSRPVLEGLVLGFGLAAGARMGMQSWFTEPVTAVDPVALVIAIIPLIVAAAIACFLPARRAASVDPNVALRHL